VNWQKQAATGKTDATASDTQAQAEEAAKRYSRQAWLHVRSLSLRQTFIRHWQAHQSLAGTRQERGR